MEKGGFAIEIALETLLKEMYDINLMEIEEGWWYWPEPPPLDSIPPLREKFYELTEQEIIEAVQYVRKTEHKKNFIARHNMEFIKEMPVKLARDFTYLNSKFAGPDLNVCVSMSDKKAYITGNIDKLKTIILTIANRLYGSESTWEEFEIRMYEIRSSMQPPALKEHLKFKREDVLVDNLDLLHQYEKLFPSHGHRIGLFDPKREIQPYVGFDFTIEQVIEHLKSCNRKMYTGEVRRVKDLVHEKFEQEKIKKAKKKEQAKINRRAALDKCRDINSKR